jgi:hypothetical protein
MLMGPRSLAAALQQQCLREQLLSPVKRDLLCVLPLRGEFVFIFASAEAVKNLLLIQLARQEPR